MVGLGAVAGGIGVPGREPGVGIGDVGHEHHAQLGGELGGADAPGGIERNNVGRIAADDVPEAGRGPELDDAGAVLLAPDLHVVEEVLAEGPAAVGLGPVGHGDEADAVAEGLLDDVGVGKASLGKKLLDAPEPRDDLVDFAGLGALDVEVDVGDRARGGHSCGLLAIIEALEVRGGARARG